MATAYIGYYFTIKPKSPWDEILLAQLESLPFESFEMTDVGLNAFVPEADHSKNFLTSIALLEKKAVKIQYDCKHIEPENWNAKWESNFTPIHIGSDCVIRADFHPSFNKQYEIIINPKMSFGTGHHQTTHMMMEFALNENIMDKTVLDMGCGTGILSIIAAKKGAQFVHAIDNDPWCTKNTRENAHQNACSNILVTLGSEVSQDQRLYDIIFANINRNVLLDQIPSYATFMKPGATLLLSGFYKEDLPILKEKVEAEGIQVVESKQKQAWCALRCVK